VAAGAGAVAGAAKRLTPLRLGIVAIAATVVVATIWSGQFYRDNVNAHASPYILTAQENGALRFLERTRRRGGVLSSYYLGAAVPAFTGRETWVGHYVWTPRFLQRALVAEALFDGRLPAPAARAVIERAGVRYVLADCGQGAGFPGELGSLVGAVHRFGCVTVYELA
jgi:hypothetical protein